MRGGGIYAEGSTVGPISIFSGDKKLESTKTLGTSKPTAAATTVGEITVEVGQTVKDTGFINTFKTAEAVAGDLEYGTTTFSTSLSGVVVDGQYYDIQNDTSNVDKMTDYVTQDVQSAVSVNYDIKNQTGGNPITYAFKGKKSTEGKDVYVYYHYSVNGKAANGQEITRGGYLGYKIKVTPGKGGLIYDANGGTIRGQATFDDVKGRVEGKKAPGAFLPTADVDIISDVPVRDGYTFAFWYNKGLYPDPKEIYTDQTLGAGNAYEGPANLTHYEMSLLFGYSKTVTLTAVWDKEYELKFDANGGDGMTPGEEGFLGINLDNMTLKEKEIELGAAVRTKGGEFKCWRDGNKDYAPGAKITLTEKKSKITLKAIWNITTEYVDNKGNKLQDPVVAEEVGEQKTFPGYSFVKKEDTAKGVKYIYEKNKITTQYVDDKGNKIKEPVVGEEKGPKEIEGYKFLREEATDNGVKYIYEKINAPQPDPNPQPQPEPEVNHDWEYITFRHHDSTPSTPVYVSVSRRDEDKKETKTVKEENTKVVKEAHIAYIMGYPDNTVRPNNTLTRAEAVAMVTRLSKLDLSNKSRAPYADLKDKAWYLPNINAGLKAGMLDADEKGNLRPNEPVTRGEFVKMVAAIDEAGNEKAPFNDIAGHKYEKEINQLYSNKHIFGYEDGSFKPDAFLTRAEAASILNRVFNRVTNAEALKGFEDKIHKFSDLDKNAWYYYEMVEATNNHESETRNGKDSLNSELERWTKLLND
ncbi:S-layer homology domain-containing protein [Peptoniphilus vaginalis]|uniref:S-layer homology domain-containing protein n=1 Tax=Peptoniphilus vaginalis TaxID=1756987 RepID=UPI0023F6E36C|nr:S-layer homology domain-containing protein [Peptoniphilus vaginalis]